MGYDTKYQLKYKVLDEEPEAPLKCRCETATSGVKFCPHCGMPYEKVPLLARVKMELKAVQFPLNCRSKWYEHDVDMTTFSKRFPTVLFILDGEGENGPEDMWRKYYVNGLRQFEHAQITYGEFDKKKLEQPETGK